MNVKRYVVDSLPKAMEQIKKDLGKDAVILHTKKVKQGGVFGFFGKNKMEVIAAVDSRSVNKDVVSNRFNGFDHSYHPSTASKKVEEQNQNRQTKTITSEVNELKELKQLMIKLIMNQQGNPSAEKFSKEIQVVYDRLVKQEVKEEIAANIIEKVVLKAGDNLDHIRVIEEVKRYLLQLFSARSDEREISEKTKIVHFVGPTGVGKTTTIAKLAAEQVLKHKRKIGFITSDTYRIAAVEQLKTYAEILNSPLEVVFSAKDTQLAIEKMKNVDLIFMDTAGRNYSNELYVSELKKILPDHPDSETFLVLSLTHKFADMVSILEHFQKISIDKIIFTKFDETVTYGSILNLISMYPYKVSYITDGQNVPDDIEIFQAEKIVGAILGG